MIRKNFLNIFLLSFVLLVMLFPPSAQSASYTSADRQTLLNDLSDFFATAGKGEPEKRKVKRERRALRRSIRLENEREKKLGKTQKKIKKQQKNVMDKIEAEKKAKKMYRQKKNKRLELLNVERSSQPEETSPYFINSHE